MAPIRVFTKSVYFSTEFWVELTPDSHLLTIRTAHNLVNVKRGTFPDNGIIISVLELISQSEISYRHIFGSLLTNVDKIWILPRMDNLYFLHFSHHKVLLQQPVAHNDSPPPLRPFLYNHQRDKWSNKVVAPVNIINNMQRV